MNEVLYPLVLARGVSFEEAQREYSEFVEEGYVYCPETVCFYKKEAAKLIIGMPMCSNFGYCDFDGHEGYKAIFLEISYARVYFYFYDNKKNKPEPIYSLKVLKELLREFKVSAQIDKNRSVLGFNLDF